jgi:hypothetical protein
VSRRATRVVRLEWLLARRCLQSRVVVLVDKGGHAAALRVHRNNEGVRGQCGRRVRVVKVPKIAPSCQEHPLARPSQAAPGQPKS